MKSLVTNIRDFFLSIVFSIFKRKGREILIIPHENCEKDGYDIFRNTSDNALILLESILRDKRFSDYNLSIVYYDENRLDDYLWFSKSIERKGVTRWLHRNDVKAYFIALLRCNICLTDHPHYNFRFKSKKQSFISLGYFTPFKDDNYVIKRMSSERKQKVRQMINKSFDYHTVSSSLTGRIISLDTLLDYSKFIDLGFPRNDVFYREHKDIRCELEAFLKVGTIEKIICYTPTYRDYERQDLEQYDESMVVTKSVLGYLTEEDEERISKLLEDNKTILIVKNHTWQDVDVNKEIRVSRIIPYDTLKDLDLTLYDFLAVSDCLITDYTCTSFDYMHSNKPIIYYFYDFEKYLKTRGFSFDPIQPLCGGPIAYNADNLINSLQLFFGDADMESQKRNVVHDIINKYHDGASIERIKEFILKL